MSNDRVNEKVNKTVLEMYQQRGYTDIIEEDDRILATKPDGASVCMFTDIKRKLNIQHMQEFMASLNKMKIKHGIIVCDESTPSIKTVVNNAPEIKMTVEIFNTDELLVNITKHVLVPKHECIEESKKFKEEYGSKFPILLKSDPIARFYNFERGSIIKVTRRNGFVAFRIVK